MSQSVSSFSVEQTTKITGIPQAVALQPQLSTIPFYLFKNLKTVFSGIRISS